MVNYFISYTFLKDGKSGSGNIDIKIEGIIKNIDRIRSLEKGITEHCDSMESVVITNYIILSEGK